MSLTYKRKLNSYKFLNKLQKNFHDETKKMIVKNVFRLFSNNSDYKNGKEEIIYTTDNFIYVILSKTEFYVKV